MKKTYKLTFSEYPKLHDKLLEYVEYLEKDWGPCFEQVNPPPVKDELIDLVLSAYDEDLAKMDEPWKVFAEGLDPIKELIQVAKALLSNFYFRKLRETENIDF